MMQLQKCISLSDIIVPNRNLIIIPEHLSSPPVFSGVRVTRYLVLCVCLVDRCLFFCTFLLAIVLSILLRYTDSDYPFGIFKLFLIYKTFQKRKCFSAFDNGKPLRF